MIAKKDYELIKAIKNHKCCGKDNGSSNGSESSSNEVTTNCNCLTPMIVRGTTGDSEGVIPDEGSPTWSEAYAHILAGGLVYFIAVDPIYGVPAWVALATYATDDVILFGFDQENGVWWMHDSDSNPEPASNSNSEGGGVG